MKFPIAQAICVIFLRKLFHSAWLNIISISHLQVVLVFSPLIGIVEAVIIPFNFHHGYSIQTVSLSHLGQEEADCIVKVFSFT